MKRILIIWAIGSLFANSPLLAETIERTETMSIENSRKLIDLMSDVGVPQDQPVTLGSIDRHVNSAYCSAPVIPNPPYRCTLQLDLETLTIKGEQAKQFFELLEMYAGLYDDGTVGASKVRAVNIKCSQVADLTPQVSCSFDRVP